MPAATRVLAVKGEIQLAGMDEWAEAGLMAARTGHDPADQVDMHLARLAEWGERPANQARAVGAHGKGVPREDGRNGVGEGPWLTRSIVSWQAGHPALNTSIFRFRGRSIRRHS